MAKKEKSLPKTWGVVIFVDIFLLCQASFFLSTFGNIPAIKDTINFTGYEWFPVFFNTYYIWFCIVAGTIELILCCVALYLFAERHWPTLLTIIMMWVNMVVCNATATGLYLLDLRQIYFSLQVTFAIPILSIFLSSVFLIDDAIDLAKGKFEIRSSDLTHRAQIKMDERAKGTIVETAFDITEASLSLLTPGHESSQHAATNAIPKLNKDI